MSSNPTFDIEQGYPQRSIPNQSNQLRSTPTKKAETTSTKIAKASYELQTTTPSVKEVVLGSVTIEPTQSIKNAEKPPSSPSPKRRIQKSTAYTTPPKKKPSSPMVVGIWRSKGSANGSTVYEGPRGGYFYHSPKSNKPVYVTNKIDGIEFFSSANQV
jgi:hypothetical protein